MALQTKTVLAGDYAYRSWSNGYVISLTLTEESVDTVNNTSLVSYLFTISNTDNNRFASNDYSWNISIGGQSIAINHFNFDLSANYTTQTIASGQVTVKHNANGALAMPYSVSIPNVQNWSSYGPPAMSLSGTWDLTPIQVAPPTISDVYIVDDNSETFALTGNRSCMVRYYSNAFIGATATAHNGTTITKMVATCGDGKKITSKTEVLTGTIKKVESSQFTIQATDNKGNTTEIVPAGLTLVEYVKLTCDFNGSKPGADGSMTFSVSGNYFNGSFGAVNNTLTVQYRYRAGNGNYGEWITLTPVIDTNIYWVGATVTGLDYKKAYTFQARAIDALATVTSARYTARALPVFDWGENDFRFNVPVFGITPDMVGARYCATDGAFLLSTLQVESGILLARDSGNESNYYLGFFYGHKEGQAAVFCDISTNTLSIVTNSLGTVHALNAVGAVTYAVIPFFTWTDT